jgi:hypothetical protein
MSQDHDLSNPIGGFEFQENVLKTNHSIIETEISEIDGFEDEKVLNAYITGDNKKYKLQESSASC